MRKKILAAIALFLSLQGFSQSVMDSVNLKPMLYETFAEGAVLLKSGEVEKAPLNYNTDNQNMVFIKNGKYLVLSDLEAVDTVYLQHKKFIPVKGAFFEVLQNNDAVGLCVAYTNKVRPLTATTDKDGTKKKANAEVSNTVSDIYVNRVFRGNYSVEILRHFWLVKGGMLFKANSARPFYKLFPTKKEQIGKFIKENAISFYNEPDLIKLVAFCNK